MSNLLAQINERHKRFNAEIARRASLIPQKNEPKSYFVPNTPFGVKKIAPPKEPVYNHMRDWYHCMWFFDLVHTKAPEPPPPINIAAVIDAVSNYFNVSKTDILSARRDAKVILPRQIGYYLARKLTLKSMPEIGRRFGGRDHTSALSGIRKIERLRLSDPKLEADLHAIAALVGGSLT